MIGRYKIGRLANSDLKKNPLRTSSTFDVSYSISYSK